jgi:recombination protein RecA
MAKKFNFSEVVEDVKKTLQKDKSRASDMESIGVGNDLPPVSTDPKDYVVMPDWWNEQYGVLGLPFGKIVQIAGDSDTGKTSLCILAMKAAQEQGYGIVYVETEGKTSPQDLTDWGVDPEGIMLVQSNITEKAFDVSFRALDKFFELYPQDKVLYVFDSFGNTISMHDDDLDIVSDSQRPGGAAKTNRVGLGRLIAKMEKNSIATLIVNYDSANIGSNGNTQAGGKALKFYTMIGIRSSRVKDWVKQVGGEKVKAGAFVKWDTFKNHYQKSALDKDGNRRVLPKELSLRISAAGIEKATSKDTD